jgi:hypothetical protein
VERVRAVLALVAVVAGTLAGGWLALDTYNADRVLSVGTVRLSVEPGHSGALDVYVPLVDWGARFDVIRVPARLSVDVRTVDRRTAGRIAEGAELDLDDVREEARDGIASYLRILLAITFGTALGAGVLVALAVRSRSGPRLRWLLGAAGVTATAGVVAFALLLQPRGSFSDPEYYANGADVPRALEAFEQVQRSTRALDEELNAQLVGLARLVISRRGARRSKGARRSRSLRTCTTTRSHWSSSSARRSGARCSSRAI